MLKLKWSWKSGGSYLLHTVSVNRSDLTQRAKQAVDTNKTETTQDVLLSGSSMP
jgi:hypothetical protein